jgi:hypothetical protein
MGRRNCSLIATLCIVLQTMRPAPASAQETPPEEEPPEEQLSIPEPPACHPPDESWLDRKHGNLHRFLWRSARSIDGWFGAQHPEEMYAASTRGSITPIILWDEYNGFSPKFRFRVKIPFPHLDERYNAFVGTFSRDEFVTEREQASGAIPRQRSGGEIDRDQTLVGVQFRGRRDDGRREGGRFEADAGIRIRSPIDPFVKGGYRLDHGFGDNMFMTWRETAFWQNSEGFGVTSRIDFDRTFARDSLLRWTASATISQESEGVRGYSALTMYRGVGQNQAVAAQLFTNGEFDADVPLGEYGVRLAYRRRILHDWLVLELRPSLTWPKEEPEETRSASWGFGIGLEMFFGEDEFQTRPATF